MEIKGIDVSSYQGKPDWTKAKSSIKFAILRVTEKNGIDSSFEYNYKNCKSNGIPVGVYKYSYALTTKAIKAEAEEVVNALAGRGLDFPVWLDLEWNNQRILAKETLSAMIKTFRAVIVSAGYKFGIYCNADWYKNVIPDDCKAYEFWIASYPSNDTGVIVEKLRPSYGVGWQYSSKGKVPGISGSVDMDVFYKDYAESDSDFAPVEKAGVTADDVISVMRKWIGRNESDGTHKGIIDIYNSHKPLARGYAVKYTDQWCDTTISAAFITLDAVDLIGGTECGVERHVKLFQKAGIWIEDGSIAPKPGDIIVFSWKKASQPNDGYSDHIGIVESVKGNTITTIEGNYKDSVKRRIIAVGNGYIRGYARPKYATGTNSQTTTHTAQNTPTTAHTTLRKGSKGSEVKTLQTKLNYLGYALVVDGDFGAKTYTAVKAYQKSVGLSVDGVVGKQTWAKLDTVKSVTEVAKDILAGKYGNQPDREKALKALGYTNYTAIQKELNRILKS